MPLQQPWIDPNTGATFPQSVVVFTDDSLDPANHVVGILYRRFAALNTYSGGFAPVQITGTAVGGVAYGSWFQPAVQGARASLAAALQGATASYVAASPEFSGAVFF